LGLSLGLGLESLEGLEDLEGLGLGLESREGLEDLEGLGLGCWARASWAWAWVWARAWAMVNFFLSSVKSCGGDRCISAREEEVCPSSPKK